MTNKIETCLLAAAIFHSSNDSASMGFTAHPWTRGTPTGPRSRAKWPNHLGSTKRYPTPRTVSR
jgi:hypothetical protein